MIDGATIKAISTKTLLIENLLLWFNFPDFANSCRGPADGHVDLIVGSHDDRGRLTEAGQQRGPWAEIRVDHAARELDPLQLPKAGKHGRA